MWLILKTHMLRSFWISATVAIIVATLCGFAAFFDGLLARKMQEIDDAYDSISVPVVVSNLTGTKTDGLDIYEYLVDLFLSDHYVFGGEEQLRPFSAYVKDVEVKASVCYSTDRADFSKDKKLIGVTVPALKSLENTVQRGQIVIIENNDTNFVAETGRGIVIPKSVMDQLCLKIGDDLELFVKLSPSHRESMLFSFLIIGYHTWDTETVYCSFDCIAEIQYALDGKLTADSLVALVEDNRKLEEFRELLMRHFAEVDPSGHTQEMQTSPVFRYYPFAVTIHDEKLRETLHPLNRNLQTLLRLRPLLITLELVFGTGTFFSYFWIRRRELMIARSLGTTKEALFSICLIETLLVCIIGIGLSLVVFILHIVTHMPNWFVGGIILASLLGTVIACLMIMNKNEFSQLKETDA